MWDEMLNILKQEENFFYSKYEIGYADIEGKKLKDITKNNGADKNIPEKSKKSQKNIYVPLFFRKIINKENFFKSNQKANILNIFSNIFWTLLGGICGFYIERLISNREKIYLFFNELLNRNIIPVNNFFKTERNKILAYSLGAIGAFIAYNSTTSLHSPKIKMKNADIIDFSDEQYSNKSEGKKQHKQDSMTI